MFIIRKEFILALEIFSSSKIRPIQNYRMWIHFLSLTVFCFLTSNLKSLGDSSPERDALYRFTVADETVRWVDAEDKL
jgi:hypothetical protein